MALGAFLLREGRLSAGQARHIQRCRLADLRASGSDIVWLSGEHQSIEQAARILVGVRWLLRHINFYHFHDTSRRSALRTRPFADAGSDYLRSDGSNLPTFLLGLRESEDPAAQVAWRRIEDTVRRLAPFISELRPCQDRHGTKLEWVDERGATFGPAHLSDGTLRALALVTALAQPNAGMPLLSCIDEPELGLHPAAVEMLGSLISSVSVRRQVVVATQSPVVLDCFEPKDVIVAERRDSATVLRRLDESELDAWLDEYSLSELYDKNVLGGRP